MIHISFISADDIYGASAIFQIVPNNLGNTYSFANICARICELELMTRSPSEGRSHHHTLMRNRLRTPTESVFLLLFYFWNELQLDRATYDFGALVARGYSAQVSRSLRY